MFLPPISGSGAGSSARSGAAQAGQSLEPTAPGNPSGRMRSSMWPNSAAVKWIWLDFNNWMMSSAFSFQDSLLAKAESAAEMEGGSTDSTDISKDMTEYIQACVNSMVESSHLPMLVFLDAKRDSLFHHAEQWQCRVTDHVQHMADVMVCRLADAGIPITSPEGCDATNLVAAHGMQILGNYKCSSGGSKPRDLIFDRRDFRHTCYSVLEGVEGPRRPIFLKVESVEADHLLAAASMMVRDPCFTRALTPSPVLGLCSCSNPGACICRSPTLQVEVWSNDKDMLQLLPPAAAAEGPSMSPGAGACGAVELQVMMLPGLKEAQMRSIQRVQCVDGLAYLRKHVLYSKQCNDITGVLDMPEAKKAPSLSLREWGCAGMRPAFPQWQQRSECDAMTLQEVVEQLQLWNDEALLLEALGRAHPILFIQFLAGYVVLSLKQSPQMGLGSMPPDLYKHVEAAVQVALSKVAPGFAPTVSTPENMMQPPRKTPRRLTPPPGFQFQCPPRPPGVGPLSVRTRAAPTACETPPSQHTTRLSSGRSTSSCCGSRTSAGTPSFCRSSRTTPTFSTAGTNSARSSFSSNSFALLSETGSSPCSSPRTSTSHSSLSPSLSTFSASTLASSDGSPNPTFNPVSHCVEGTHMATTPPIQAASLEANMLADAGRPWGTVQPKGSKKKQSSNRSGSSGAPAPLPRSPRQGFLAALSLFRQSKPQPASADTPLPGSSCASGFPLHSAPKCRSVEDQRTSKRLTSNRIFPALDAPTAPAHGSMPAAQAGACGMNASPRRKLFHL